MQIKKLIFLGVILPIIINWGDNSSIQGQTKHRVNFYGTVETATGKILEVDNISISRLFRNIPVYDVPTNVKNYKLLQDPRKGIITKLDLSEIASIELAHPKKLWSYKQKRGGRTTEFIEIIVISKGLQATRANYLVPTNRTLLCDEKNEAGPIEKIIPLTALKEVTINGYTYRDQEKI